MKVKLFTHTDLDGVGCAILAKTAFEFDDVDISYCNYSDIDKLVVDFISSDNNFTSKDMVFITDISVDENTAELIENFTLKTGCTLQLLDHHATALWLNKYEWAKVDDKLDVAGYHSFYNKGIKSCGTQMFYSYLIKYLNHSEFPNDIFSDSCENFVEHVRMYDTWEWKAVYADDIRPKNINDLLYIYGRDRFVDKFVLKMSNDAHLITEDDFVFLEIEKESIDKYVESKNKQLKSVQVLGRSAGVVFAERYISELGNRLSILHPEFDFIAIVSPPTISYRTVKGDINLGADIAREFGGGGHAQAAGSQISSEVEIKLMEILFDKGVYYEC